MSNTKKKRRAERAAQRADSVTCPLCRTKFVLAHHPICPKCGHPGWTRETCARCDGGIREPHPLDKGGPCSMCGGAGWMWYRTRT